MSSVYQFSSFRTVTKIRVRILVRPIHFPFSHQTISYRHSRKETPVHQKPLSRGMPCPRRTYFHLNSRLSGREIQINKGALYPYYSSAMLSPICVQCPLDRQFDTRECIPRAMYLAICVVHYAPRHWQYYSMPCPEMRHH